MFSLDPEFFTIQQNKEMGLWPPADIVGPGVYPYINRMKRDKLRVADVGVMKGENAYFLLEKCPKIVHYFGIVSGGKDEYQELLKENVKDPRFKIVQEEKYLDVVCLNAAIPELDKALDKWYDRLKNEGILCGNEHHLTSVKEALGIFRKKNKNIPLFVAKGSWFIIKR